MSKSKAQKTKPTTKRGEKPLPSAAAEAFLEACTKALRKSGARVTQPRIAVIRCLASSETPLSARDVFERIQGDKNAPSVDQVSVYRILDTLCELELLHQVFPSGGYLPCLHQECSSKLHVLIRCSECEFIEELDVPQETLAPMIWYLKDERGFYPDEHMFQLNGLCSKCKKRSA